MHRIAIFLFILFILSCRPGIKEQEDEVYSRHLQRKVKLSIIHTPVEDKSTLHLLILNDGQDFQQLGIKYIVDSLWEKDLIQPLLVVGVHAGNREQEYGVAGKPDYQNRGSRAGYYDAFVNNELYFFIKKKVSIRKFKSVVMAGCSLGGLSAFDIAWNHPEKIDKAGIFSGSFWWRDKDVADSTYEDTVNRIMYAKIKSSRKKPSLQYWFYAGGKEETNDRDKDGITDVTDDTQDLVDLLLQKKICTNRDIVFKQDPGGEHNPASWKKHFPEFLLWAFGK